MIYNNDITVCKYNKCLYDVHILYQNQWRHQQERNWNQTYANKMETMKAEGRIKDCINDNLEKQIKTRDKTLKVWKQNFTVKLQQTLKEEVKTKL